MIEGMIFDVDGTLLNSMSIWMDAGKRYLEGLGYEVKENIGEIMFDMTMAEAAEYMQKKYGVNFSIEEICEGINSKVYDFYAKEAMPKEGVREFLEYAYSKKIPMTVATSTDRPMIETALKRTGFDKYFRRIFTTTEVGKGKDNPEIFEAALEEMESLRENTWLFEDALYSIKTAKSMGINICGIYDFSSDAHQGKIKEISDIYIKDWNEYEKVIEQMKI